MQSRRTLLALLPLLVAGCTLIDQRAFRAAELPPPPPKPPAPPPPEPAGPAPLVRIQPGPSLNLRADLRGPVQAARARKPGVAFTVTAMLPPGADPAPLEVLARDAASAIAELGVARTAIELTERVEPWITAPEVRVYVH